MVLEHVLHCYLAYIDILGFTNYILNDDKGKNINEYIKSIKNNKGLINQTKQLNYNMFSDNLIIYSQDDEIASFKQIVRLCSILLFDLIQKGIPIRGSISHGDITINEKDMYNPIIIGKPVIEAYKFEQKQNWIGMMLNPSTKDKINKINDDINENPRSNVADIDFNIKLKILEAIKKLGNNEDIRNMNYDLGLYLQKCSNIPFEENDLEYVSYVIIPRKKIWQETDNEILKDFKKDIQECMNNLEKMMILAPDPKSQKKYINTKSYLKKFIKLDDKTWNKL